MNGNKLVYVGQKAFIEKGGDVLILKDPNIDGIDFPGGKIGEGESDIVASLKREVLEETGLEIEVGDPFCAWLFKFPPSPKYNINEVYLVGFKCRYVSGEVKLSDEHTSFLWVNKNNYQEIRSDTPHFKALEKYFSAK